MSPHAILSFRKMPMSKASLNTLPVELIHRIINHLDIQTIFLLLYKVCKRFQMIIKSYHRYKLDFCLISKSDFYLISHLIHCENIISITISDGNKTRGQMKSFFHLYNLNQFTKLRSLNLLQINRHYIDEIFKSNTIYLLHSLKLQCRENLCLQNQILTSLVSVIKNSNLNRLDFNLWFYPIKEFIWPNECILKYLKIYSCSLEEYITILRQTPHLQTFILEDLVLSNRNHRLFKPSLVDSFQQLKSLTLENCHRYMYQIEYLLLFTPSLIHLKIVSDTSLLDGYRWERCIQTNLSLLKTFEFFFVSYSHNNLNNNDVETLIKPYQTAFWIDIKQWFVTCEYIKNLQEIRLYSLPICKTNHSYYFHSNKIVYSTSDNSIEMNQVSKMHLNWSQTMEDMVCWFYVLHTVKIFILGCLSKRSIVLQIKRINT